MNLEIVVLIGIAIVILIVILAKIAGSNTTKLEVRRDDWPFYSKKPLTHVEQILFHRMVKALPEHIVLAQVQVSRILGVKRGFNFHEWNNRINRLSLDFIVCLKDATVIAAIELDDSTHNNETRAETDKKKNKAIESAGIKIIRWQAKQLPTPEEIRASINGTGATPPCIETMRVEPTL